MYRVSAKREVSTTVGCGAYNCIPSHSLWQLLSAALISDADRQNVVSEFGASIFMSADPCRRLIRGAQGMNLLDYIRNTGMDLNN